MSQNIKVTVENGTLTISIPENNPPTPSKSGKSLLVGSTNGNIKTEHMVNGKLLTVSVNAYIAK